MRKSVEKSNSPVTIDQVSVEERILLIRGQKVILDADLAILYGTATKVLVQAVKRNISRFPEEFMFRLTKIEKAKVVTNCDHLNRLRFSHQLPLAFTEYGIAMLSSVLNSERAVKVNIAIIRIFIRTKKILATYKELDEKLSEHGRKIKQHDEALITVYSAINKIMKEEQKPKGKFGFV